MKRLVITVVAVIMLAIAYHLLLLTVDSYGLWRMLAGPYIDAIPAALALLVLLVLRLALFFVAPGLVIFVLSRALWLRVRASRTRRS